MLAIKLGFWINLVIGFCESLLDMLAQYTVDFNGIIMTRVDDIRLIGALIMVAILGKDHSY